jgi:hypothetical protein
MRVACLVTLAACGGAADEDALRLTTSFVVTEIAGAGTSPLDPLLGQSIDIEIVWPTVEALHGTDDPQGCKTTVLGFFPEPRTAKGPSAALVQREILDMLPNWDMRLQLCDAGAGSSTIAVFATINELNLAFGCFGVPASAQLRGSDGYPLVTTFTADQCNSTILDVVNNRVLMNRSFAMTIVTGPSRIP